jgi:excinuclease ABC subunit B
MESAYPVPGRGPNDKNININRSTDPNMLFKQADEIEKTMLEHARNLEFEDAARLRDELEDIRNTAMGIND